ncbi:hypothetical protein [Prochlorococcus marinus]|nr:hypothetical protein [Prochlorococcus marinus]
MEDFLPVGMAFIERVQKGGLAKVIDGVTSSDDPIQTFRGEGSSAAQLIREKLDEFVPGLGNPALEVKVSTNTYEENDDTLVQILSRIEDRVDKINSCLENSIDIKY